MREAGLTGERGPAGVEERERCREPGGGAAGGKKGKAKPPACEMLSWQHAEKLGSTAVPRAREGAMKKQPEWGKDCLLQT